MVVPELSYRSLAVQNGMEAQVVWEKMLACPDAAEKQRMVTQLRNYCHLDTLAMVKIHEALSSL